MLKNRKGKNKKYIILAFFIIVLLYILGNAISIWRYGNVDEKCEADVAIVLGAGTYDKEVSPVFRERINHGIWLYENGYVKKIIFTGGYGE